MTKKISFLILIVFFFSGCASQKSMFKKAKESDTIEDYEKFLAKYPNGEFSALAKKDLSKKYFEEVEKNNTIQAYEDYLTNYPNSDYSKKAKEEIAYIKCKNTNSPESYRKFLSEYPSSEYSDEIKNFISQFDPLSKLIKIASEIKDDNYNLTQEKIDKITLKLEKLSETDLELVNSYIPEDFQEVYSKVLPIDSLVSKYSKLYKNINLWISYKEIQFRTATKVQNEICEYTFGGGSNRMFEYIAMMKEINIGFNKLKSEILDGMITLLNSNKNSKLRKRHWVAIERMLRDIDLKKSKEGYEVNIKELPFVVRIDGNLIIKRLKAINKNEKNDEVKAVASKIISNLKSKLD